MKRAAFILLLLAAAALARNESTEVRGAEGAAAPVLAVIEYDLPPGAPATVTVQVENRGGARSDAAILRLTFAGESIDGTIPALDPGSKKSVSLDAAGLLPTGRALAEMDFQVEAIAAGELVESNETNNRKAHKGIEPRPAARKPDLRVKDVRFSSPSSLEVLVKNEGEADAAESILRLRISTLGGAPVPPGLIDRAIPPLLPSKSKWVTVEASGRVGPEQSLRNADFVLSVDPENQLKESNEDNNLRHHSPE